MALKPIRTLSKDGSIHITDEFYNTLISTFGAVFSLAGTILLIFSSIKAGKSWHVFSFSIYGTTLTALFTASALHHGVNGSERTDHLLRQLDYYAIYLAIAGTFTPFCLILLKGYLGWSIFGLIWFLAILGIVIKTLWPALPKWISTALYCGMGWLGVVMAYPIYQHMPLGLIVLIIGGLFFTVGAVIYFFEKPNPFPGTFGFHEIWHLFVFAGAASHFCAIYFFLLPY